MRKKHILVTAWMMVITTWLIYRCNYTIGIPFMIATFVTAVKGIASCLRNILDLITQKREEE